MTHLFIFFPAIEEINQMYIYFGAARSAVIQLSGSKNSPDRLQWIGATNLNRRIPGCKPAEIYASQTRANVFSLLRTERGLLIRVAKLSNRKKCDLITMMTVCIQHKAAAQTATEGVYLVCAVSNRKKTPKNFPRQPQYVTTHPASLTRGRCLCSCELFLRLKAAFGAFHTFSLNVRPVFCTWICFCASLCCIWTFFCFS